MKEKDLYSPVQRWIKSQLRRTCAIELKIVKGKSFNFKELKPHQVQNLLSAKNQTFTYKIPDVGFDQKPFDIVVLSHVPAFVAVVFYEERKKKNLYLMDIDVFFRISGASIKPTLSELEFQCFSSYSASLKGY